MKENEKNTISVKQYENFEIKRPSNPSTGYKWYVEYDSSFIELLSQQYIFSDMNVGSGGYDQYLFRALRIGSTNIKLIYKKTWEEEDVNVESLTFLIKIN